MRSSNSCVVCGLASPYAASLPVPLGVTRLRSRTCGCSASSAASRMWPRCGLQGCACFARSGVWRRAAASRPGPTTPGAYTRQRASASGARGGAGGGPGLWGVLWPRRNDNAHGLDAARSAGGGDTEPSRCARSPGVRGGGPPWARSRAACRTTVSRSWTLHRTQALPMLPLYPSWTCSPHDHPCAIGQAENAASRPPPPSAPGGRTAAGSSRRRAPAARPRPEQARGRADM